MKYEANKFLNSFAITAVPRARVGMANVTDRKIMKLSFLYRGRTFDISIPADSKLLELGHQLESATGVEPHTLRLLMPRSPALIPFSEQHRSVSVRQSGISEGRAIRLMGVLPNEIEEVSKEAFQKYEKGTIGFDEEIRRAEQRAMIGTNGILQLPKGNYIFCDFKTLELPGIQLHPPAEKALQIMHKLASDPGIVAIMNKHRWRVGIMTEMAPEGYVGISPECILGFNKNKGEEISLRLRTDDLKGFRKYESIKKTLLHELAHMVHSEHDANFHALNSQLNTEANTLDWTKSAGHSLSGFRYSEVLDSNESSISRNSGQKLGGSTMIYQHGVRSAAAHAALFRLSQQTNEGSEKVQRETNNRGHENEEPDGFHSATSATEPDPDLVENSPTLTVVLNLDEGSSLVKDDHNPDEGSDSSKAESDPDLEDVVLMEIDESLEANLSLKNIPSFQANNVQQTICHEEADTEKSTQVYGNSDKKEIDALNAPSNSLQMEFTPIDDKPDLNIEDTSLQAVHENTDFLCRRIQDSINLLKQEATPSEALATIQTLLRIVKNVKEHPNDAKFRCLKKKTVTFHEKIAKYKGALDVLHAVGFSDAANDGIEDDVLILKRDDPVILWLAQSSLEVCIA